MNAQGSRDDRICGGEDDYYVQQVKQDAIANSETFVTADKTKALLRGKTIAGKTVIKHGEAEIITFHQQGDNRSDPARQRQQRHQCKANEVEGLPDTITKRHPDTSPGIFTQFFPVERMFFVFYDGFGLFTEIGKHRRPDNKDHIFKKRKIEQHKDQPEHHTHHHKKETEPFASFLLQPGLYTHFFAHPGYGIVCCRPEEIHAYNKEYRIDNTGNDNPFPELMLLDKTMGF